MRKSPRCDQPAAVLPAAAPSSTDPKRRRFLLTLGVGGAGAAVASVASLPAVGAVEATHPESATDSEYRETSHVRDYYRTARL